MSGSKTPEEALKRFENAKAALDCVIDNSDIGKTTVRNYLRMLLKTLWEEAEGFSGKRPFGNSGWQTVVTVALIKAGIIPGKLDEYGYAEDYESDDLDLVVLDAIDIIFQGD